MYPARKTVRNSSFSLKELSPPVLDRVFTLVRFKLTNEFYGLRLLLVVDNARAYWIVLQSNYDNYPFRKYYFFLAVVELFKATTSSCHWSPL